MSTVADGTVLVRRLDVTARRTDQVVELSERAEGGVLLETWIGRYVLDSDARVIWLLIDGRRTFAQIVDDVAGKTGLPATEIRAQAQLVLYLSASNGLSNWVAHLGVRRTWGRPSSDRVFRPRNARDRGEGRDGESAV